MKTHQTLTLMLALLLIGSTAKAQDLNDSTIQLDALKFLQDYVQGYPLSELRVLRAAVQEEFPGQYAKAWACAV